MSYGSATDGTEMGVKPCAAVQRTGPDEARRAAMVVPSVEIDAGGAPNVRPRSCMPVAAVQRKMRNATEPGAKFATPTTTSPWPEMRIGRTESPPRLPRSWKPPAVQRKPRTANEKETAGVCDVPTMTEPSLL